MKAIPTVDIVNTGKHINDLRKSAGLSVKDIQNVLGLSSTQAIYKWLSGQNLPTVDNLVILASILNVSLDDLIIRN